MVDPNLKFEKELESNPTPRELVLKYIQFLPWFSISIAIFLIGAYLKLRYSVQIYQVKGNILVKEPGNNNSNGDKFDNIFMMQTNKNINDEMQVIKSRSMAQRVVHSLGYETLYYNVGKIRTPSVIFSGEAPFKLEILKMNDSTSEFSLHVFVLNDQQFSFAEKGTPLYFGQPFQNQEGIFRLNRTIVPLSNFSSRHFIVNRSTAEERALDLVSGLTVSPSGDATNILALTYETENPKMGVEIVNQFMEEYQRAGLTDKRQQAVNALKFIDDQLADITKELGGAEQNLQSYREKHNVFNPSQQVEHYMSSANDLEKQITEQGVRIKVLDLALNYIRDTTNHYPLMATSLGINEPSFLSQISEFNRLLVQRESLLKTTPRANPIIRSLETEIEKLRQAMMENLVNVRAAYNLTLNDLIIRSNSTNKEISAIPSKEKELLDITRRKQILEQLYNLLLQKRLETAISSASTISGVKVIEAALASGSPISPNSKGVYMIAFFLGLLIPAAVVFLVEFLNDKVKSRNDIQKETDTPILGEVGHSDEGQALVVTRKSRKFIAEQFRIIRTNLQYVLPKANKQVLLVTSTISGEGKTFVSINLGAVMALVGKKTVIFEFDIRKPKILGTMGLESKAGITNYLISKASFEELVLPVPGVENLFVIPCGPVPPNPAELLFNEKLGELIERAKQEFEVIVIDTAPVGLVSDANTLGKHADATLYIVRHNHTLKKQLQLLNDIYLEKRLPKVTIVVNDIEKGLGYGYQYGYGYGNNSYGYGYGSGYFEEEKSKESWIKRTRRKLHL